MHKEDGLGECVYVCVCVCERECVCMCVCERVNLKKNHAINDDAEYCN